MDDVSSAFQHVGFQKFCTCAICLERSCFLHAAQMRNMCFDVELLSAVWEFPGLSAVLLV